jgi:HlyD family secretion protein
MKKAGKIIIGLVGVALGVSLLLMYIHRNQVTVGGNIQPDEITGSIEAQQTDVNVKVAGRVSKVYVDEGDKVMAGQSIAEMEADNLKAKSQQVKAVLDLAQSTYNRINQLYRDGVSAQQTLDKARTDLEQARAAYDEVQSYLNDCRVKAPISGTVTLKTVENGELVSTGMALVTISDLRDMHAEVKIRETALEQFPIGQRIPVKVMGVPHRVYQGKVYYISPKPSYATERAYQEKGEKDVVSFLVKIKLDNSDGKLYPGMTAIVSL